MENEPQKNNKKRNIVIFIITLVIVGVITGVVVFLLQPKNPTGPGKEMDYNWSEMQQGPYKDMVMYATGTSLTSWTDSEKVIATHASVPDVIYKDSILYVYFVDVSEDGKPEQIGLLKSSDKGATWSVKQIISIAGLAEKVAVDPAPFVMDDGRIRLYYFDISKTRSEGTQNNSIYSAISTDGVNFTEESGVRFTYPDIYDPDVIKVGNIWRMYVGTAGQQVLSATSSDGLNFTYEGVALSGGAIPNVILENNLYYLFTGGIEISTSTDGITFTKTTSRFDSGGLTADPGVAKIGDGEYFMVYKTSDATPNNQNSKPSGVAQIEWPSVDAKYITAVPVDPTKILSISKYRSCAGHDRSGYSFERELETDRSMKHYFYPVPLYQGTLDKVEMYAPFDGTVFSIDYERDKIGGRPNNGNGITFTNSVDRNVKLGFGHLYFVKEFQIGESVVAGQLIGYAALGDPGNDFDIDLMGMDGAADREILGSIFDHMTPAVLAEFEKYNVTPQNMIVSKSYRDANPCNYTGPDKNQSALGGRDGEGWVQLAQL